MTTCIDTLGPQENPILCNSNHCNNFQQTSAFHRVCNCRDWQDNLLPHCDPKDNLFPVQTGQCIDQAGNYRPLSADACQNTPGCRWQICYCCCSCFAATTPVAVPDGFRQIGDVMIGDLVLTAIRRGDTWVWSPQEVQFSSGSPPQAEGSGNLMFYIEYGDAKSLIATPNQLFLMTNGKLKRADQLVPGRDSLVSDQNQPVQIVHIRSGMYKGGIHHIATTVEKYDDFTGSIDAHLINVNGIISGDYLLQLYQDTPKMQPNMEDIQAPSLGTRAYATQHPHLYVKPHVVGMSVNVERTEVVEQKFHAHGPSTTLIPDNAASLFSDEQETHLLGPNIPKRAFSDKTNMDIVNYYARLYTAFYPTLRFFLDWENSRPNVFAFEEYNQQTVVIGGEFLRLGPLYGGAMAVALAFGVGSLLGGNPVGTAGYTTVGQALYLGIGVVMRTALQGGTTWIDTAISGQAQMRELLKLLIAESTDTGSSADRPLLQCLIGVIDAAVSGDELPTCAGGPTIGGLKLQKATYDATGQALVVTYNQALSPLSATQPKNYIVTPQGADITAAIIDPSDSSSVRLTIQLIPNDYSVTVRNVRASDGSTLDPKASIASFRVEP